jgi:hypothetical protein
MGPSALVILPRYIAVHLTVDHVDGDTSESLMGRAGRAVGFRLDLER